MEFGIRIPLIVGAILTFAMICRAVRKRRIQIDDSLFWIAFTGLLVIIAIFPQIVYVPSNLLGFHSPSNFIFLIIIAVLIIKVFRDSSKISVLKYRLNQLAQAEALDKLQTHEKNSK